ncbi:SUMO1 sentrin specific peptidase 8 [Homalodisca vitripennis]|nr:SUMO1 sentrin specific peptidase 8 [Homalodisca vitripennis]
MDSFIFDCTNFNDDASTLVSEFCIQLDKLVSNCDYDCNELINGASGVVLKFDDVCGQLNDVCGKYERLKEELDYLSAQRDVERNSHRSELNISLSNNDHLVNEKNTLEVKIKDISKKLSKAENTNSQLRNLQAEHDNIVNDYETVQCANRKLIVENSRLKKLVEKNESICNVLKDKLLVNTNKIVQLESSLKVLNNKWLSDEIITDHIRLPNSEVTRIQNDILFVNPTLTQLLKLHSRTYVDQALSDMSFYNKSWVFFVLNNCDQGLEQNGGSHWSLLLLDNTTRTAIHYDSVRGLNERHAAALLVNLGLDSVPISEGQTFQQTESFECGVHVLVNARLLLGQVCDRFALTHNTLHHTDTSETHGSTNATLVPSSQSSNNSRSNLANDKVWKVVKGKKCARRNLNPNKHNQVPCKNRFVVLSNHTSVTESVVKVVKSSSGVWSENSGHVKCKEKRKTDSLKNKDKRNPSKNKSKINGESSSCTVGLNNAMVLSGLCATDDMLPAVECAGQTTLEDNHSLKPVGESNYMLIGDSILRYSGKLCKENGCTVRVHPGAKIEDVKNKLMGFLQHQPKIIHFHVGTNNLPITVVLGTMGDAASARHCTVWRTCYTQHESVFQTVLF